MSIYHINPRIYGNVHFFGANRCFNTEKIKKTNQYKITCEELVSFDCGLFELHEIGFIGQPISPQAEQIIAAIMRPCEEPNLNLQNSIGFVFCGYDLVEELSSISAITNCGGSFDSIDYHNLTEYGLIPTYKEAVLTQQALLAEAPNEPHADCEIIEIWRKLL